MTAVSPEVLRNLSDPIREALWEYVEITDHRLTFDVDAATRLEPTGDKPNSARSTTPARYGSQDIGKIVVIAFAPGDCTGDESSFKLADLEHKPYPDNPGIVPRSKAALHSEGHLPIASMPFDTRNAEPVLYAGHLDLLGISGQAIKKIATLGQSAEEYATSMLTMGARPVVTATVGYSGGRYGRLAHEENPETRFGDPHAVYNATKDLQVCAFVGLSAHAIKLKVPLLNGFKAVIPSS